MVMVGWWWRDNTFWNFISFRFFFTHPFSALGFNTGITLTHMQVGRYVHTNTTQHTHTYHIYKDPTIITTAPEKTTQSNPNKAYTRK